MYSKLRKLCVDQDWNCWLCNDPMDEDSASLDHVLPLALGGAGGECKAAHKICNSFRGHDLTTRPHEYYREHRIRIEIKMREKKKKKKQRKKLEPIKHDDYGVAFVGNLPIEIPLHFLTDQEVKLQRKKADSFSEKHVSHGRTRFTQDNFR